MDVKVKVCVVFLLGLGAVRLGKLCLFVLSPASTFRTLLPSECFAGMVEVWLGGVGGRFRGHRRFGAALPMGMCPVLWVPWGVPFTCMSIPLQVVSSR